MTDQMVERYSIILYIIYDIIKIYYIFLYSRLSFHIHKIPFHQWNIKE